MRLWDSLRENMEYFAELLMVVLIRLVLYFLLWIFALLMMVLIPSTRRRIHLWSKEVLGLALFLVLLAIFGGLFAIFWKFDVVERLYHSIDIDTETDFLEFFPPTQEFITRVWYQDQGRLLSASMFQLQLVWLIYATGVWSLTVICYSFIMRRISFRPSTKP